MGPVLVQNSSVVMQSKAALGSLASDLVILQRSQMTRATPKLAPSSPNYHINRGCLRPDRFNIQRHSARTHDTLATGPQPRPLRYNNHTRKNELNKQKINLEEQAKIY
ncbi:hypothetical protein TNCV_402261 [Trichonephila clavipes]|nr:hypothetical protein TNCV_402261 [Trichonephila clavipes]